jgi:type VI secretion system protein ImpF
VSVPTVASPDRIAPHQPLLFSVLDRLLEEEADAGAGRARRRYLSDLKDNLRRDLEHLLNTHQSCIVPPPELSELATSLIDYGMPHFLGLAAAGEEGREAFADQVRSILRRFEPRFKQVTVTVVKNPEAHDRTLRFRIDGLVHADPEPELVSFQSTLEPAHRRFAVRTLGND